MLPLAHFLGPAWIIAFAEKGLDSRIKMSVVVMRGRWW
jgi:hypothetical protein